MSTATRLTGGLLWATLAVVLRTGGLVAMSTRMRSPAMLARLGLDLVLTSLMLSLFSFNFTGLSLHEWLGLALCVVVPVHMLVSWAWLAAATRRLFTNLPWTTRLTYLLNGSLFVALVVVTITGLVISEVVMPGALPMSGNRGFWRVLHTLSSNASLVLMGLHVAVYWRTLLQVVRKAFGRAPGKFADPSRIPSDSHREAVRARSAVS
jgi:cytochrome b561